jgi:hypothetical protein
MLRRRPGLTAEYAKRPQPGAAAVPEPAVPAAIEPKPDKSARAVDLG